MTFEQITAFIDNLRKTSDKDSWKPILNTQKPGCGVLYKGRGANSFEANFGINLAQVIKKSAYQVKIGNINYADVKESNGFGREVKARSGDMSWVPGYEKILLQNNKTGEYLLRCYLDKETTHYDTTYALADGSVFNPYDQKYKAYLRENAQELPEDFTRMFDIKIEYISNIGGC